jgi:AraC-like DNA-binding protein
MRNAGKLIAGNRADVSGTAAMTGFSDSSYFTSRFKKFFGMTPREYRAAAAAGHLPERSSILN